MNSWCSSSCCFDKRFVSSYFCLDFHRLNPEDTLQVALRVAPLWHSQTCMATTLTPVDSREVVRCDHCLLVQFRTSNNNCRRCHASLDEEPEPEPITVA